MYPSLPNKGDGPRLSRYRSAPYGPTLYGVRSKRIGYGFESSLGTYTEVNSLTPSRIGMRYSYLVYPARTASFPWPWATGPRARRKPMARKAGRDMSCDLTGWRRQLYEARFAASGCRQKCAVCCQGCQVK